MRPVEFSAWTVTDSLPVSSSCPLPRPQLIVVGIPHEHRGCPSIHLLAISPFWSAKLPSNCDQCDWRTLLRNIAACASVSPDNRRAAQRSASHADRWPVIGATKGMTTSCCPEQPRFCAPDPEARRRRDLSTNSTSIPGLLRKGERGCASSLVPFLSSVFSTHGGLSYDRSGIRNILALTWLITLQLSSRLFRRTRTDF